MPVTLAQAQAQLAAYLDAETAALRNQEYTIGNRSVTRADLKEIRAGVQFWNGEVARLSSEAQTGSSLGFYRGVMGG
jgi:hypothetical protein